jgi:alpha-beta hydrolase superfamily lysophospholipase
MGSYQHTKSSFSAADGWTFFYQSWECSEPKGIVVLAHGVGEHSGRYQNIIDKMEGRGISIYGLDHRGHGRSEGKPVISIGFQIIHLTSNDLWKSSDMSSLTSL